MIRDSGRSRRDELGEALGRVESEIRQAKAEALGRVGERLDQILGALARIDQQLEQTRMSVVAGSVECHRLAADVAVRNQLRDAAARLVRDLIIQREAIGIVHHTMVRKRYPVPPPYRLDHHAGGAAEASGAPA